MLEISARPIDVREVETSVLASGYGGVVTFSGVVRDRSHGGRAVTGLAYEAHETMALAEFESIVAEAKARFGALSISIAHRVGELAVGEVAVVVCVACAHRAEAFAACRYAIDELKARASIWKKEVYADGGGEWISNEC